MTETPDHPTQGHNAAARKKIIRDVMQKLDGIDGQIAELQEERTKLKNVHVKGDLGMKVADFNILRRFRNLDDDNRDSLFDTLREGFKALNIGVQSSFLETLDKDEDVVEHNEARPATKLDAENFGYLAGKAGKGPDDMPVMRAKAGLQKAWLAGNERGLVEFAESDKNISSVRAALDDFDRDESETAH